MFYVYYPYVRLKISLGFVVKMLTTDLKSSQRLRIYFKHLYTLSTYLTTKYRPDIFLLLLLYSSFILNEFLSRLVVDTARALQFAIDIAKVNILVR